LRLAFFSDSHGDAYALRLAMETVLKLGQVDLFAFLGDGIQDFYDLKDWAKSQNPQARFEAVRGNNDPMRPGLSDEAVINAGGVWLYLCHGHRERVKLTLWFLADKAKDRDCRAALFGHTHVAFSGEKDGILLLNPGSVSLPVGSGPTCGVLDIGPNGELTPRIIQIRTHL
jgi:putative phosphoesterase